METKTSFEENGLKEIYLRTTAEKLPTVSLDTYEKWEKWVFDHIQEPRFAVVYLDHEVRVGRCEDRRVMFYQNKTFHPRFLQKARVFDERGELFLWRIRPGTFHARLRLDHEAGEKGYAVEASQLLWGTRFHTLSSGWSLWQEDRGVKLILPLSTDNLFRGSRVRIVTRNYVGLNKNYQSGYVDCRFVRFEMGRFENAEAFTSVKKAR